MKVVKAAGNLLNSSLTHWYKSVLRPPKPAKRFSLQTVRPLPVFPCSSDNTGPPQTLLRRTGLHPHTGKSNLSTNLYSIVMQPFACVCTSAHSGRHGRWKMSRTGDYHATSGCDSLLLHLVRLDIVQTTVHHVRSHAIGVNARLQI